MFRERLQVVWLPKEHWRVKYGRDMNGEEHATHIPLMQDAFIDNTVVREEVIHKVVEVKVWDEYHRKKKNPQYKDEGDDSSDSGYLASYPPKDGRNFRPAVGGEGEAQLVA